jgi:hypothetical protein
MSNVLAFSEVGAEEVFELTAETAHANGIDHDDSWVGDTAPSSEEFGDDEICWCKFYESCPSCFGQK